MNGCVSTSVLLDSRVSGERAADLEHAHRFQGLSFDPVFIVGDHRSGTTVLYQLLASTGAFSVVTAYHVICYDRIVADHLFKQAGAARQRLAAGVRRLDHVDVQHGTVAHPHRHIGSLHDRGGDRFRRRPCGARGSARLGGAGTEDEGDSRGEGGGDREAHGDLTSPCLKTGGRRRERVPRSGGR